MMKFKEIEAKIRINKANGQLNVNLPKKQFTVKQLDKIQSKGQVKLFMEDLDA